MSAERRAGADAGEQAPGGLAQEAVPAPGVEVGGFVLEKQLGAGSFGTVYRAHRDGCWFAVKFIRLARAAHWAERELQVMARLPRECGAALESHGRWPVAAPRFFWLAMRYVRGQPLDAWAKERNPTGREVAHLVQGVAEQLARVHAAGVVHRDVKEPNILVRAEDGRPVLVDFGVGTYVGALEVTGPLPPGTWCYHSPEIMRYRRTLPEARYEATPADDLWALGVVLYRLLTNRSPFEGEQEGAVVDAILSADPVPPHVLNRRVPTALGALCLRMLAKSPQARYPDASALAEALKAAREQGEASWEVPLCEGWRPDNATTVAEAKAEKAEDLLDALERQKRVARHEREHPRRGRPPAAESPRSSPSSRPPSPEVAEEAVRAPGWRRVAWAGGVLGFVLVCLLAAGRLGATPDEESTQKVGILTLPSVSPARTKGEKGQEVAPPWKPPEVDGGAAPPRDATPMPVATLTPPEESRVKTPQKKPVAPSEQMKRLRARLPKALLQRCALAVTAAQLAACVSTGNPPPAASEYPLAMAQGLPPEKPPRPPVRCEPDIERTMREQMGDLPGFRRPALFATLNNYDYLTVREGPVSVFVPSDGKEKLGDSFTLHGHLVFGRDRVYGYFTRLVTMKRGEIFPVCMMMIDQLDHQPGVRKQTGSRADLARIFAIVNVETVAGFDE